MKRERLLIVTPSAVLRGGVERIIESLASGLPARGFDVTVALARGARFHDPDRYRRAYPQLAAIEMPALTGTREERVRAVIDAVRTVSPSIVLNARVYDAFEALARLALRGSHVRNVVTVQAWEAGYIADLDLWRAWTDGIVTSGRMIARAATSIARIAPSRVRSIAGGVSAPSRRRIPSSGPLRIGYVGRIEQNQKRVLDLVEILDTIHARGIEFTFALAGDGPDRGRLLDAIGTRPWRQVVVDHGWLETDDLYERVYPELDVFLHCAAFEGVTIAPREAMVHGAVPVISRFPGLETEGIFLHERNSLTFEVADVPAAAAHIGHLALDRALLERMSRDAAASQQGELSEDGAIDAWAAFFREILELPKMRGLEIPSAPPDGKLSSLLGESLALKLRRWSGRRHPHLEAGGEWPHTGRGIDPERFERVQTAMGREVER